MFARKKKIKKGPHYHRIPEVRARRRKITTLALAGLILTWMAVSFWLMQRSAPKLPGGGGASARPGVPFSLPGENPFP